jgi:hypothetical protein
MTLYFSYENIVCSMYQNESSDIKGKFHQSSITVQFIFDVDVRFEFKQYMAMFI